MVQFRTDKFRISLQLLLHPPVVLLPPSLVPSGRLTRWLLQLALLPLPLPQGEFYFSVKP